MNNIDRKFRTHLFVELFLRQHRGLLWEQSINNDRNLLFEEYGVFNGCEKIARRLMHIIKEKGRRQYHYSVNIKNCDFIDSLDITMNLNRNGAAYLPNTSNINQEGKYDPISLDIGVMLLDDNEGLLACLMHELLHAYQDMNLKKKGTSLEDRLRTQGYFKNQTMPKGKLQQMLYYINSYEVGAYVNSIVGELKSTSKFFTSIDDVMEFIKNTITYKNYQTIMRWCNGLEYVKDPNEQKQILKYGVDNTNIDFTTYNQFLKWLKTKCYKIQRKFNTIVPKLAYDHLQMGGHLKSPNRELIDKDLPLL